MLSLRSCPLSPTWLGHAALDACLALDRRPSLGRLHTTCGCSSVRSSRSVVMPAFSAQSACWTGSPPPATHPRVEPDHTSEHGEPMIRPLVTAPALFVRSSNHGGWRRGVPLRTNDSSRQERTATASDTASSPSAMTKRRPARRSRCLASSPARGRFRRALSRVPVHVRGLAWRQTCRCLTCRAPGLRARASRAVRIGTLRTPWTAMVASTIRVEGRGPVSQLTPVWPETWSVRKFVEV